MAHLNHRLRAATMLAGLAVSIVASAVACSPRAASRSSRALVVDTIASGLGIPVVLAWMHNDTVVVGARDGSVSWVAISTGQTGRIPGLPTAFSVGDGGITDIALDPAHESTGVAYVGMAIGSADSSTLAVMRGQLRSSGFSMLDTLLVAAAWDTARVHYGGRLAMRTDELFVSVGDRHQRQRAQDLSVHHGKILRIRTSGAVPTDNPFVHEAGARPEIWSYGHRNPQGLVFDADDALWSTEHGPRHGDELNRIERGRDYGWPRVSWGWEYEGGPVGEGLPFDTLSVMPSWVFSPGIAPSDLLIHSGRGRAEWKNRLFLGAMSARRGLVSLSWNGSQIVSDERLFPQMIGRVRSLAEGPDGYIYVGNDDGQILRIRTVQ